MAWGMAALIAGYLLKKKAQKDYEADISEASGIRSRRQDENLADNTAEIMKELQQFKPETRQETLTKSQGDLETRILDELDRASKEAAPSSYQGKVSSTSLADKADSVRRQANDASAYASLLSKVRSPEIAARAEADKSKAFALARGGIASRGRQQERLDTDWLNSIRPDAKKEMLGSALMTYGAGSTMGSAGAGAGGTGAGAGGAATSPWWTTYRPSTGYA